MTALKSAAFHQLIGTLRAKGSIRTRPATAVGRLGGGPCGGAAGDGIADENCRAGIEMGGERQHVAAQRRAAVVAPADRRVAVAAQVHGHGAIAGGDELRREEAVFLFEVAEARRHDDQRSAALIGIGDATLRAVEEDARH